MSAARAYRSAVLALTEDAAAWRARVLTAGNRLDAAVLALMVEAFNEGSAAEADDMIDMEEWERVRTERTAALLKGEPEKP